jgi:hypothetical protein
MRDSKKYFLRKTSQKSTKNRLHNKITGNASPANARGQNVAGDIYNDRYDDARRPIKKRFIPTISFVAKDIFPFVFFTGFFFVVAIKLILIL